MYKITTVFTVYSGNVPEDRCVDVFVPVGTAGAGFLWPDALPDANQTINIQKRG